MGETGFGPDEAKALLESDFAPWVAAMGVPAIDMGPGGARFLLPVNPDLQLRGGPGAGLLCGQAVAAVADTAAVLALAGANGRFRKCTTVDMSLSFIRPLPPEPVEISVELESNGKSLAVCRIRLNREGHAKAAAIATATFMYLEP